MQFHTCSGHSLPTLVSILFAPRRTLANKAICIGLQYQSQTYYLLGRAYSNLSDFGSARDALSR